MAALTMPNFKTEHAWHYATDFVFTAINLCNGNGTNPKVKVVDVCGNKYPLPSYAEIELLDLLKMAAFGLRYRTAIGEGLQWHERWAIQLNIFRYLLFEGVKHFSRTLGI